MIVSVVALDSTALLKECQIPLIPVLLDTSVDVMQLPPLLIKEKMPTSVLLDITVPKELVNQTTVL